MTVQAISIGDNEGNLLFYRNYEDLSQDFIEDCNNEVVQNIRQNFDETFLIVQDSWIIFSIQDDLIIQLIVSYDSNIIDDLHNISHLRILVSKALKSEFSVESVEENFPDLMIVCDQMVSMGYAFQTQTTHVDNVLNLFSNNERIQEEIQKEKEREQRENLKQQAEAIRQLDSAQKMIKESVLEIEQDILYEAKREKSVNNYETKKEQQTLQEDKQNTQNDFIKSNNIQSLSLWQQRKVEQVQKNIVESAQQSQVKDQLQEQPFNPLEEDIVIYINEIIKGKMLSNGQIDRLEIQGSLQMETKNPSLIRPVIQFENQDKKINLRLSPSFNKQQFQKGIIELKENLPDIKRLNKTEILKYSIMDKNNEDIFPLEITTWISDKQFSCEVNFNVDNGCFQSIESVSITYQDLYKNKFNILQLEQRHSINQSNQQLIWSINSLDKENSTAAIILSFDNQIQQEDFYPAIIYFESKSVFFQPKILKVLSDENEYKFANKNSTKCNQMEIQIE